MISLLHVLFRKEDLLYLYTFSYEFIGHVLQGPFYVDLPYSTSRSLWSLFVAVLIKLYTGPGPDVYRSEERVSGGEEFKGVCWTDLGSVVIRESWRNWRKVKTLNSHRFNCAMLLCILKLDIPTSSYDCTGLFRPPLKLPICTSNLSGAQLPS